VEYSSLDCDRNGIPFLGTNWGRAAVTASFNGGESAESKRNSVEPVASWTDGWGNCGEIRLSPGGIGAALPAPGSDRQLMSGIMVRTTGDLRARAERMSPKKVLKLRGVKGRNKKVSGAICSEKPAKTGRKREFSEIVTLPLVEFRVLRILTAPSTGTVRKGTLESVADRQSADFLAVFVEGCWSHRSLWIQRPAQEKKSWVALDLLPGLVLHLALPNNNGSQSELREMGFEWLAKWD